MRKIIYNLIMSQSFHLYQLQKIDTQLDQGAIRIQEISVLIESDHRIANQQAIIDEATRILNIEQSHLKRLENEVNAKRVKLEQSESSLYGGKVRVPKELQDLQSEVASLKRSLAGLEDQQLEAMLKVEEAQAVLDSARHTLISVQALVASETAALAGERSLLENLQERLLKERNAVLPQITLSFQEDYERLRKNKRGMAVAALQDEACSGCGTQLTPADRQYARSPNQTYRCPSCGRFIYAG